MGAEGAINEPTHCHQADFSKSPCAWLAINDVPIERWLANHLENPDTAKLGLSLMWLLDEQEDELAERRFIPAEDGTSTLVPLLVCSDDMDFDCIVLMTEQVVEGDTVHWNRFGWSASGGLEVGVSTRWIRDSKRVSFALNDFSDAISGLKDMMGKCTGTS
jgi:hypothetical protein